ncbi:MAG: TonB-dependent receptor, partial [Lentilitoribacter sp.]
EVTPEFGPRGPGGDAFPASTPCILFGRKIHAWPGFAHIAAGQTLGCVVSTNQNSCSQTAFLKFLLSTSVLTGIVMSPALAQGDGVIFELEEVVVTAGRNPVAAEKVGRASTVLTAEELETSQVRYVADALRRMPGVAVSRTGSFGGFTQIRIRGSEANHVLVLIDGVEVAGTSSGEYDFGTLQMADIERIEVIRGPQSALYGSNAAAGVIQIITKGGVRNGYKVTGRSEVGTDKSVLGNVLVQGGGETFDIALSGPVHGTEGFNISDFGSEKDGDRNVTLNGKARWDITDDLFFDGTLRLTDRDTDTDDQEFTWGSSTYGLVIDTPSTVESTDIFGGGGLTWELFDDRFVQKFRGEFADLETRGRNTNGQYGDDGTRYHLSYQGTFAVDVPQFWDSAHSLTGAVEWERETYQNAYPSSPSQAAEQERDLFGTVAEYRGEFFDRAFVTGALRYDHNDSFKDTVTYSISGAYLFPQSGTRLHTSLGTGSTDPTFFEQFGFTPSSFIGNPDLKPETNFGWDVGIEQRFWQDRAMIDVTYFNERLEDEIQTQFLPSFESTPVNLDGASKRQGVEVSLGVEILQNLYARASYTYLDAQDPTGAEEVRRPPHSGSVGLTYGFHENRGTFFLDAIYNGQMKDKRFTSTGSQRVTLNDYFMVNAGADYQVTDHLQVFGRVENLLDQDYEEVYGFNTQGFTAFAGLKATF